MIISSVPNFYVVIPDVHTNGKDIMIQKIKDIATNEIVKQIPSEEEIARMEKAAEISKVRIDNLA